MTRINTIAPALLTDQHLLAEYRELPRIFALARAAIARGIVIGPDRYTLGRGHVLFFYSRTDWLSTRQAAIIAELLDRGYHLAHTQAPDPVPGCGVSGWTPDAADVALNLARLRDRLHAARRPYTHRGAPVGRDFYDA
jgi:hypothetical protein